MTDPINTAEMNRDQLESTATELDIKFQKNTGDDTLRERINEALGITPAEPPKPASQPKAKAKAKMISITVHTHDQDKQPVQVGVNGRLYVIERGKKVSVPESVIKVLETAVQDIYDPKTMKKDQVMAYPFTVHGEA